MQWDPETGSPMGQVGNWVFIAFLYYLRAEMSLMQTEISWEGVSPWPIITFWDLLKYAWSIFGLRNTPRSKP
jgi:hypothetical protein